MTKHNWKYDGLSFHNGEYWYKCTKCGATDWIASYGTEDQLRPKKCKSKESDLAGDASVRSKRSGV